MPGLIDTHHLTEYMARIIPPDLFPCFADVCRMGEQFCNAASRRCNYCYEHFHDCFTYHQQINCTKFCIEQWLQKYEVEVKAPSTDRDIYKILFFTLLVLNVIAIMLLAFFCHKPVQHAFHRVLWIFLCDNCIANCMRGNRDRHIGSHRNYTPISPSVSVHPHSGTVQNHQNITPQHSHQANPHRHGADGLSSPVNYGESGTFIEAANHSYHSVTNVKQRVECFQEQKETKTDSCILSKVPLHFTSENTYMQFAKTKLAHNGQAEVDSLLDDTLRNSDVGQSQYLDHKSAQMNTGACRFDKSNSERLKLAETINGHNSGSISENMNMSNFRDLPVHPELSASNEPQNVRGRHSSDLGYDSNYYR